MSNKNPAVSVIVPSMNGRQFIGDCLSSLERQRAKDFETIVVDNGSTDGSVEYVKQAFPWVAAVVANQSNLGFARACNQGIGSSRGDLIALLNNDTEADVAWIEEMVSAAQRSPDAGMFASKTLFFDRRDTIDTAGHLIYPDGLNRGRGRLELDRGQYDDKTDVFFPSGAAAVYRRRMLDEIGLFDEHHFAYGDDTDIGIRGRLAGWRCIFVPRAVVYHRYSATTGEYSPIKVFLVERNRIWIVWKYFPARHLLASPFYSSVRYLYQAYGALSGRGAAGRFAQQHSALRLIPAVMKAYASALSGAPRVWGQRRQMKSLKKVADSEIDRWFKDYRISVRELSLKD